MTQGSGDGREAFVELGIEGYERATAIGRGGYSVVYRAWEPAFERDVAIKIVSTDMQADEVDRFARECAAIGRLAGHPNIVTVHKAGRTRRGQPYIVMEFLSGGSLAEGLPMGWAPATEIGVKLAGALESAHQAGVLHRDVKPGNVMLSRYGDCKLGDFGIARMEGRAETRTGLGAASWEHAPPEIVDQRRPTTASDVYSLASTLFNLIDGRSPYALDDPESPLTLLARVAREPVRPMRGPVPEPVQRVIRLGLAKDPSQRPQSAAAFGRQLQEVQATLHMPVTVLPLAVDERTVPDPATEYVELSTLAPPRTAPRPQPAPGPPAPSSRRGRWVAGVAAAAVIAGVVAVLASSLAGGDGGQGDEQAGASSTVAPTTVGTSPPMSGPPASTATTSAPAAAESVRLGQDLQPASTEQCRTPATGSGAAWQLAPQQLGGRSFPAAYYCNLFAGGTGSLDFVLGGSYALLTTSIGFADGSTSTSHMVRFEFIGDGRENLYEPTTLRFGQHRDLRVDVSGVTRLKIRITEISPAGGSEGASRPVLAAPTLTR